MRTLLIQTQPHDTGIGMYSTNLFNEMKKSNVDIFDLSSSFAHGLASSQLQKIKRACSLATEILVIPRGYNVYHISSHVISIACSWVKPTVLTLHDTGFSLSADAASRNLYKLGISFVRSADMVICPSEFTRRQAISQLGLTDRKTCVIPHGIDHNAFHERSKEKCRQLLGIPRGTKIILSVSTTLKHKNLPTLLMAFQRILAKEPMARLIRVGAPTPKSNELDNLAKSLGISPFIEYMRPTDEQLPLLYNASDVFLHTSIMEGFGAPILEAMASGLPVVVSNAASIPEVVDKAGILLDPFDVNGFSNEVLQVLSNREVASELSQKGILRSEDFHWSSCAESTLKVYETVAGKADRHGR